MKAHLAARDVRSPPEPVLPGYLQRPRRRAPTCRGPIIKVSQVLQIGGERDSGCSWVTARLPLAGSSGHPMTPHPPTEEREGPGHSWRGAAFIKDLRPAQDPSPYSPPPHLRSAYLGPGTSWHSVVAIILFLFFAVGVMTNVHGDTSVSEWPLGVESCPTTPLTDARKLGTARSPRAQPWAVTPGPALPVLGVGAVSGQLTLQVSGGHEDDVASWQ